MILRYDEIMEKVEVTDEMRKRILSNISEKASKKKKKVILFPNGRYLSTLAACVAIVLLCVTVLHDILNTKQPNEDNVAVGNEIVECEDLAELSQYAGFKMNEITDIPFDIVEHTYTWWFGEIAQIEYIGNNNMITYRVARSKEDISGDYNTYSKIREEMFQNNKVTMKGNENKAYVAIWQSGEYSYAICSSNGIAYSEMKAIIEALPDV